MSFLENAPVNAKDLLVVREGLETKIAAKQDTIGDGDLTMAKTNGLQSAIDDKITLPPSANFPIGDSTTRVVLMNRATQATSLESNVTTAELGHLSGVTSAIQTQLGAKQATIGDGDLTIARTNGLQSALNGKLATSGGTISGTLAVQNDVTIGDSAHAKMKIGTYSATDFAYISNANVASNAGSYLALQHNGGGAYFNTADGQHMRFRENNNDRFIYHGGHDRFGINTTNPQYKMDIIGNMRSYGFTNSSDRRIKKDIEGLSDHEGLSVIRQLEVKKYKYLDTNDRPSAEVYGFIAQDVAEVLPHAVDVVEDVLPNVCALKDLSGDVISGLDTAKLSGDLLEILQLDGTKRNKNHIVKYNILDETSVQVTEIVEAPDESTKTLVEQLSDIANDNSKIYVQGNKVSDFHTLQKDCIYTPCVAAVKELDTIVQNLMHRVQSMESVQKK